MRGFMYQIALFGPIGADVRQSGDSWSIHRTRMQLPVFRYLLSLCAKNYNVASSAESDTS